jgi:hypothetical protein
MESFIRSALDWSEVWALLIPLSVLMFRLKQQRYMKPVIIYLCIALVLNLLGDFIWVFKKYFPVWLTSNNVYYNIHALIRFACFSVFFFMLPQRSFAVLKKTLVAVLVVFTLVNFSFFENFFDYRYLSGNLLATQAYLLLIYCMQYYLSALRDDSPAIFGGPDFWVVTGLGIYVVISFFVFLFYRPMIDYDEDLSVRMWDFHNIGFILFCLFITKAFYGPVRYKPAV